MGYSASVKFPPLAGGTQSSLNQLISSPTQLQTSEILLNKHEHLFGCLFDVS